MSANNPCICIVCKQRPSCSGTLWLSGFLHHIFRSRKYHNSHHCKTHTSVDCCYALTPFDCSIQTTTMELGGLDTLQLYEINASTLFYSLVFSCFVYKPIFGSSQSFL